MRKVNWEYLDKDKIISLIIDNSSIERVTGQLRTRIKSKLENMTASELWNHVYTKYGGELYEPDSVVASSDELRTRERAYVKAGEPRVRPPAVPDVTIPARQGGAPLAELANTDLSFKRGVKRVFQYDNQLVVCLADPRIEESLSRYIARVYPGLDVHISTGAA